MSPKTQRHSPTPSLYSTPTAPPVPPTEPDSLLVALYPALAIILSRASYASLLALRTTCKAVRDAADVRLMYHLQIRDDPTVDPATYLEDVRTPGGRIPAFMPREDGCWLGPVKVVATPVAAIIPPIYLEGLRAEGLFAEALRAEADARTPEPELPLAPLSAPAAAQRARCLELLGHTRVLDLIPVTEPSSFPWDAFVPMLDVLRVVPNGIGGVFTRQPDGGIRWPLRAHTIVLFMTSLAGTGNVLVPEPEQHWSIMLHPAEKVVAHFMYAVPGEYGAQYGLRWAPRLGLGCVGDITRELVLILSPLDRSYRDLVAKTIAECRERDIEHCQGFPTEIPIIRDFSPKARWGCLADAFGHAGEWLVRMTCTVVNIDCVPPFTLGWGSSTPSAWIVDEIESAVELMVLNTAYGRHAPGPVSAQHVTQAAMARLTFLSGIQYTSGLTRAQTYGEGFLSLPPSQQQAFPAEYRHLLPGPQGPVVGRLAQRRQPLRPISTHRNSTVSRVSTVTTLLDWSAFPHIGDLIIEYAPIASLMVLRSTSRALRDRVESVLFRHITIAPGRSEKLVVSSAQGRGPVAFFPSGIEGYPLRPLPPWLRATRRRVLGLVRILDMIHYSDEDTTIFHSAISHSAIHDLDVLRIHPGKNNLIYGSMRPSSATLVNFTTPHGDPPFGRPVHCTKVVVHILHSEGQDTRGIPDFSFDSPNVDPLLEIVLVLSPFKDQYHRVEDRPETEKKTDGSTPYRKLVDMVAHALSFYPLRLPNPDNEAPKLGLITVTMVNFHTVPGAWLGLETDDTTKIQADFTNDVRRNIAKVGDFLKSGYTRWSRWSAETWAELMSLERLQWLTGHEYVARIPPDQREVECTMENVPGERYRLLPEPSEVPETHAWTAPDPPCMRTAPDQDRVPSFFEDDNAWAWECPILNVKELFEIDEEM